MAIIFHSQQREERLPALTVKNTIPVIDSSKQYRILPTEKEARWTIHDVHPNGLVYSLNRGKTIVHAMIRQILLANPHLQYPPDTFEDIVPLLTIDTVVHLACGAFPACNTWHYKGQRTRNLHALECLEGDTRILLQPTELLCATIIECVRTSIASIASHPS